jgi:hypothetical protein
MVEESAQATTPATEEVLDRRTTTPSLERLSTKAQAVVEVSVALVVEVAQDPA